MANPQLENGYTRITNEILEIMARTKLNGTQFRIILIVWRYTYGFNRKQADLAYSYLARALEIDRRNLIREITPLLNAGIIKVVEKGSIIGGKGSTLAFVKDYDTWDLSKLAKGVKNDTGVENDTGDSVETDADKGVDSDTQERKFLKKESKDKIKKDADAFCFPDKVVGANKEADKTDSDAWLEAF